MITIKVFLASSSELKDDRRAFEIFINRKKKQMNEELHSTIRAEHIERAEKAFLSALRAYRLLTNEYLHPQEKKLIKVLAQTEAGAVAIAAYHYGRLGRDFAVERRRQAHELPGADPFSQVSFLNPDVEISL